MKMDRSLDEVPVFLGVWSATDMFGQGWGTLLCLFFVAFMLFGFAIMGASWYAVWRGSVAWSADSTSLSDMMPGGGAALLQAGHHAVQHQNSTHQITKQLLEASAALVTLGTGGPVISALAAAVPSIPAALVQRVQGKAKSASKSLRAFAKRTRSEKSLETEKRGSRTE